MLHYIVLLSLCTLLEHVITNNYETHVNTFLAFMVLAHVQWHIGAQA